MQRRRVLFQMCTQTHAGTGPRKFVKGLFDQFAAFSLTLVCVSFTDCQSSSNQHRVTGCRTPPCCAVSTVTGSSPSLWRLYRLLQGQAGACRRVGRHHWLHPTQPPWKQTQEVVLAMRIQCEAEGPLRWHRRAGTGAGPGQFGGRRWRKVFGRSGYCAPAQERDGEGVRGRRDGWMEGWPDGWWMDGWLHCDWRKQSFKSKRLLIKMQNKMRNIISQLNHQLRYLELNLPVNTDNKITEYGKCQRDIWAWIMSVKCDFIHLWARTKERCCRCQEAGQDQTGVAKKAGWVGVCGGGAWWVVDEQRWEGQRGSFGEG